MIDVHCHLDAYPKPLQIALEVERTQIQTIAVTNSPLAFEQAYPHIYSLRYVRLALGLHPLSGPAQGEDQSRFEKNFHRTSYVGEVGLDFSAQGRATRVQQIDSFRFVLGLVRATPKFVSIHSRRAERAVLDLLEEFGVTPVVFHWYSGSLTQLDRLLSLGHVCSVNPAMIQSARGQAIVQRIPPDRVLTETDGPYVRVHGRVVRPGEVREVLDYLASNWGISAEEAEAQVSRNLLSLIPNRNPTT
jgi:TatD DNase family protein